MNSVKSTDEQIPTIIEILKKGGLVIAPSDTVYGLLVDATNEKAVQKLIAFKNRPPGKPISVFVADRFMLETVAEVNSKQQKIFDQLLPGPFTIVLPSKHTISKRLESERGTIGVRYPDFQFITKLVAAFGKPITATSANLSGRPSHYSIESLLNELPQAKKELIDLIVDGGKLPRNKPSTVMDLTTPELKIVRHGDIVWKEQQTYVTESPSQTKKIGHYILSKISKYATQKPVVIIFKGDMGTGKTVTIKGIAEKLGLDDVISPTYVIYYEYDAKVSSSFKKLFHFDLFQIEDAQEFKHIPFDEMLQPGNLICIEWGDRAGEIIGLLKNKAQIVYVDMKYKEEKTRDIILNF